MKSKARQRATAKWEKANYDKYQIRMNKGEREKWKLIREQRGQSLNQFILQAVRDSIKREARE